MRRQPETIALGERRLDVRPLTIAQVQAIEPLLIEPPDGGAKIATAVAILRVALARDHADAASDLDAIEADATEIGAAMAQVLRLGGFLPRAEGVALSGEAEADADWTPAPAGSTGPTSTPA